MALPYAAGRDDEAEELGQKRQNHILARDMYLLLMQAGIQYAKLADGGIELANATAAESRAVVAAPAATTQEMPQKRRVRSLNDCHAAAPLMVKQKKRHIRSLNDRGGQDKEQSPNKEPMRRVRSLNDKPVVTKRRIRSLNDRTKPRQLK